MTDCDAGERTLRPGKRGHSLERFGNHARRRPDRQPGRDRVPRLGAQVELDQLLGARVDDVEQAVCHENALRTLQFVDHGFDGRSGQPHHPAGARFRDKVAAVGSDRHSHRILQARMRARRHCPRPPRALVPCRVRRPRRRPDRSPRRKAGRIRLPAPRFRRRRVRYRVTWPPDVVTTNSPSPHGRQPA